MLQFVFRLTHFQCQSGGRGGYGNIIPESELTPEERARVSLVDAFTVGFCFTKNFPAARS
jgi:hypothetical protein